MKITDPKTPYHEDEEELIASNEVSSNVVENEDIEIIEHLKEAKINRDKNAKIMGPVDLSALTSKLQEVKDDSETAE